MSTTCMNAIANCIYMYFDCQNTNQTLALSYILILKFMYITFAAKLLCFLNSKACTNKLILIIINLCIHMGNKDHLDH